MKSGRIILMTRVYFALISLAVLLPTVQAQEPKSALEKYRDLEFPAAPENTGNGFKDLDKGWQERVSLEFEIINTAELKSLRSGLKDEDRLVRSIAARALGIRGDKASADVLAELARNDPEYMVRIRAVESLGLLKMKLEVIEAVKKNDEAGVAWAADLAIDQFKSKQDCAAQIQRAFAVGIDRKEMGVAKVGRTAPDFTAQTLDGKTFKLSSVLGKKPIAIYFAAFDQ
jgi:hypothetical protein